MPDLEEIKLYTDGACSGNPGPGGYGVVLLSPKGRKELSGGFKRTTNNRMELMGVIAGMQSIKEKSRVTVYSDSAYVVNAVSRGWAVKWRANGWMRNRKEKAVNPDLWSTLLNLCEFHQVKFVWVKGHANNPENNRCDQLAVRAISAPKLSVDEGYTGNQTTLL